MKITVFGATGLTGHLAVETALERGHDVVALSRDASRISLKDAKLSVIEGSAQSPTDVANALRGVDAVVHCLGIGGKGDGNATTVVSASVKAVLREMESAGVTRIVCMSNVGAGESGSWFYNRVIIPVFLPWLRPIIADKNAMEASLRESNTDWVAVRLPNIVEGLPKPVRVSEDGKRIGVSVTAGSVASFLVDQLTNDAWLYKTPSVSN